MDGAKLQQILYKGYSKVGQHLGVPYAQYRSATHLLPISPANLLRSLPCAFSSEVKWRVANKYTQPVWMFWADGRLLSQFDFLVGPFATFYIGDMQPDLPIQGIETNRMVSLGHAAYSTSGPLMGTPTYYATGLPVFIQYKREEIKPSPYANATGEGVTRWLAFIPLPKGTVKQDDVMVDEEGTSYIVDAANYTSIGYVAGVRKADL